MHASLAWLLPLSRLMMGTLVGSIAIAHGHADEFPQISVRNVRRAYWDGHHNAFTDLIAFHDKLYLTFRSCPDGHMVHGTSSIVILASEDEGHHWRKVHQFSVTDRDTRDPHFLVFRNRLFVYTGTWYSGPGELPRDDYDLNLHLGYAAWTADGSRWHGPIMLEGTFGHYIWRAASHDGKAYLCGRRKIGFDVRPRGEGAGVQSALLESDDGLIWRTRSLFQEVDGDETAFLFQPEGQILAVARRGSKAAELCRNVPPYTDWTRADLGRYVGGPLLTRWGNRFVVGGRRLTAAGQPKTSLAWLVDDQLIDFAELPSGGDNSYPGWVELSTQRALVSWYSSHEADPQGAPCTAIYVAELTVDEP